MIRNIKQHGLQFIMEKLNLSLFGKFKLCDRRGNEFAPSGMKSRGVIALLALSPDFTRTRTWLQDKLWSDRFPEQSSGSLRQALSDIRRNLGDNRHVLVANTDTVSLNKNWISLDKSQPNVDGIPVQTELFPDLDIKDREFENWIRDHRLRVKPVVSSINDSVELGHRVCAPVVIFRTVFESGETSFFIVEDVVKTVTNSLNEFSDFQIYSDLVETESIKNRASESSVSVVIRLSKVGSAWSISATIVNTVTGQINWMKNMEVYCSPQEASYAEKRGEFCSQIFDGILETFSHEDVSSDAGHTSTVLANLARRTTFKMDKNSLIQADSLFRRAFETNPQGHHLSWRSWLRNLCQFEHQDTDCLPSETNATDLLDHAISFDPTDSTTLAVSAQLDYIGGASLEYSQYIAELSVSTNSCNPLANAFLANLLIAAGSFNEGAIYAARALALVRGTESGFFFEFFSCMAATAAGDYRKAIMHGELASRLRPEFKAPIRYLIPLYLETKQTAKFRSAVTKLQVYEPKFHPSLLLEGSYPAHTLRRMKIMDNFCSKDTDLKW